MKHSVGICRVAVASLVAVMLFYIHAGHAQAEPCGKLQIQNDEVSVGVPLPLVLPLADTTVACLTSVAKAALDRPLIRSLTVVVYAPDEKRLNKECMVVGQAMQKALYDGGFHAGRVSVVCQSSLASSGDKRAEGVKLTYKARNVGRSIAKVVQVEGDAANGLRLEELHQTAIGTNLGKYEYLQTQNKTRTITNLPDDSQLRVEPSSLLRFRDVKLNSEFKREVEIEVIKGTIKTTAAHQDGSSFRLITKSGVVSVKGTKFRTHVDGEGGTRIEVIEGKVELGNDKSKVDVGAGYGSRVKVGGVPEQPRPLLPAVVGMRPLRGSAAAPPALSWQPVEGAAGGYVVELAGNAEFSKQMHQVVVSAGTTTMTPPASLGQQKWFWRVQAVDADGFIGMPSKIFTFDVKPDAPAPGAPAASGS